MHAKEQPEKKPAPHRAPNPPRQTAPVTQPATGATTPHAVAALQRTAGNAAVARMLEGHQHGAGCGHDAAVQRSAADEVGSVVRSGGSRLAPSLRQEMEDRFGGEDFSDVTVHTGTAARRSAEAVGAEAYTTNTSHIVFRSTVDKKTLAHELEHVRQQRAGEVAGTDDGSGLKVSDPSDQFEVSAERKAEQVMRGEADVRPGPTEDTAGAAAPRTTSPTASVQRMGKDKKKKKNNDATGEPTAGQSSGPEKSEYERVVEFFDTQSEEFKNKKPNEKEDILRDIGFMDAMSLDDVANDQEILAEFTKKMGRVQYEPGYDEEGAGRSDWAAGTVLKAHEQLRDEYDKWGDETTLHHKISRAKLNSILKAAEAAGSEARPLLAFLDEVKEAIGVGKATGNKKALENMPANLEMGPAADKRQDDPGSGSDYNRDPESGRMTPRSDALAEAETLASSTPVDWAAVAEKLREAQRVHLKRYKGAILSPPDYDRWEQVRAKWVKRY
ncbi:eCIS core domain-containing protein [Streptomyces sp. NPDC002851]